MGQNYATGNAVGMHKEIVLYIPHPPTTPDARKNGLTHETGDIPV
jgi:hypothetical protein